MIFYIELEIKKKKINIKNICVKQVLKKTKWYCAQLSLQKFGNIAFQNFINYLSECAKKNNT